MEVRGRPVLGLVCPGDRRIDGYDGRCGQIVREADAHRLVAGGHDDPAEVTLQRVSRIPVTTEPGWAKGWDAVYR